MSFLDNIRQAREMRKLVAEMVAALDSRGPEDGDDGEIQIYVKKKTYADEFTHWEVKLYHDHEHLLTATDATFYGSLDSVFEYLVSDSSVVPAGWIDSNSNDQFALSHENTADSGKSVPKSVRIRTDARKAD